eukprot:514832_1
MTTIIQHQFADSKEEHKQEQKEDRQIAIVAVGTTGTGKSSLIKLFCGNNVEVGHGTNSQTKSPILYNEEKNSRYWLDTQGANDSSGDADEQILTDILKKLYEKRICNTKIIWCVSGDMDKNKGEFQTQANFIKNILGKHNQLIWQSCMIIKKKGDPNPKNDMDGILDAARQYGCNIKYGDDRLFGFTYFDGKTVDVANIKDRALAVVYTTTTEGSKQRQDALRMLGYFSSDEIKNRLNDRLNKIPSNPIHFEIKKCEKCGVTGDPRFIYAPCHVQAEFHHPESLVLYHPQGKELYHPAGTEYYHPSAAIKKYKQVKSYYHSGSNEYYNDYRYVPHKRLRRMSCCHNLVYDRGCCYTYRDGDSYWEYPCCNSTNPSGCTERYSCCRRGMDSEGCIEKYICCNGHVNIKGCEQKFPCCDKRAAERDNGCSKRCSVCKNEWGKSSGCMKTSNN